MEGKGRANSGMAYLLTESLIVMINRSGNRFYERLSLVVILSGCIASMIQDDPDDLARVKKQIENLRALRKAYSPKIDNELYYADARTVFECTLDDILNALLIVVYEKNLINPSAIGNIGAEKWT